MNATRKTKSPKMIQERIIKKAHQRLNRLAPDQFYVIHRNTIVPKSRIPQLTYFGILYKDKDPRFSFFYTFSQEEDEDSETHQIRYYYEVENYPPFFFAIFSNWPELSKLSLETQQRLFEDYLVFEDRTDAPVRYVLSDPFYIEKPEREQFAAAQAHQRLQEIELETMLEESKRKSGQNVGENVEAHLRSFLLNRPFARNYTGVTQNFQAIHTSLFEE